MLDFNGASLINNHSAIVKIAMNNSTDDNSIDMMDTFTSSSSSCNSSSVETPLTNFDPNNSYAQNNSTGFSGIFYENHRKDHNFREQQDESPSTTNNTTSPEEVYQAVVRLVNLKRERAFDEDSATAALSIAAALRGNNSNNSIEDAYSTAKTRNFINQHHLTINNSNMALEVDNKANLFQNNLSSSQFLVDMDKDVDEDDEEEEEYIDDEEDDEEINPEDDVYFNIANSCSIEQSKEEFMEFDETTNTIITNTKSNNLMSKRLMPLAPCSTIAPGSWNRLLLSAHRANNQELQYDQTISKKQQKPVKRNSSAFNLNSWLF